MTREANRASIGECQILDDHHLIPKMGDTWLRTLYPARSIVILGGSEASDARAATPRRVAARPRSPTRKRFIVSGTTSIPTRHGDFQVCEQPGGSPARWHRAVNASARLHTRLVQATAASVAFRSHSRSAASRLASNAAGPSASSTYHQCIKRCRLQRLTDRLTITHGRTDVGVVRVGTVVVGFHDPEQPATTADQQPR
jgi:hypothetical protein